MAFDLVITGGEVVDPGAGLVGRLDVGVLMGGSPPWRPTCRPTEAGRVVDAAGQIVTPGLIDLHTHIYWGATSGGSRPTRSPPSTGVTTWLDVGTSGAYNFHGFRRYVAESNRARCFALLNLSSIGLTANTFEFANLDYCNVDLAADDRRAQPRHHPRHQGAHRPQHHARHWHRTAAPRPRPRRPRRPAADGPHRRRAAAPEPRSYR